MIRVKLILFVTFTIAFTTAVFYPGAIYIDVERANLPIWSFWFFLFSMIITGFITLTCFILGIKISSKIEDDLKKKWKYYISGVVLGNLLVIGAELINWLNDSTIRVVWIFITLPLTILMAGLLYYGAFKYL